MSPETGLITHQMLRRAARVGDGLYPGQELSRSLFIPCFLSRSPNVNCVVRV